MPIFTGTIWDVGLGHLAGKQPEVIFTLNAPNAKQDLLYPTEPSRAAVDSAGAFSIALAPTTDMRFEAWYTLSISWLDAAGNYVKVDYPDWKLQVPPVGGDIGGIIGTTPPTNKRFLYVSLTAPPKPLPFMVWVHMDPDNQNNPQSTGNLYEWGNV